MSFESAVLHFCCRFFIYIRVTVPPLSCLVSSKILPIAVVSSVHLAIFVFIAHIKEALRPSRDLTSFPATAGTTLPLALAQLAFVWRLHPYRGQNLCYERQ